MLGRVCEKWPVLEENVYGMLMGATCKISLGTRNFKPTNEWGFFEDGPQKARGRLMIVLRIFR